MLAVITGMGVKIANGCWVAGLLFDSENKHL